MTRCGVHVRSATLDDVPALVALAAELREVLGARGLRHGGLNGRSAIEARYVETLADPTQRLVVAVDEADVVVGMALLSPVRSNALFDIAAVRMSHGVVADRHRRRGAGKALVAAATAYADEHGCDHVIVEVRPGAREVNRFFARLGFAPLVVRRVAPVATIRRRLAGVDARPLTELTRRRPLRRMARFADESPLTALDAVASLSQVDAADAVGSTDSVDDPIAPAS